MSSIVNYKGLLTITPTPNATTAPAGNALAVTIGTIGDTGIAQAQAANKVHAGPSSGADAVPTWRLLVATDIPNITESQVTNLTTDLAAKLATANNLSELAATAATARTNLGLGSAATQASSVFVQVANNLSDVTAATARTNLGLASMALQAAGAVAITGGTITGLTSLGVSGTATATTFSGSGTSLTGVCLTANNLSDVTAATARTNLGMGTAAVLNTGTTSGTVPILGANGLLASSVVTASGSAGDIQFKAGNVLSGSDLFSYDTATKSLHVADGSGGVVLTDTVTASDGGFTTISAGQANLSTALIGTANFAGGSGIVGADATLNLTTTNTVTHDGTNIVIAACGGHTTNASGGAITLTAGSATNNGGTVTSTGANISIGGADGSSDQGVGGNLNLTSGADGGGGSGALTFTLADGATGGWQPMTFRYMNGVTANTFMTMDPTNNITMSRQLNVSRTITTAGTQIVNITPTWSGTISGTCNDIKVNATESTFSGTHNLMDLQLGSVSKFRVSSAGAVTAVGAQTFSVAGALSTPAVSLTGAWLTSTGTATTTKPQLLVEASGATSTAWSTAGTGLGVNAATGFTGNLIDAQTNAASKFKVDGTGNGTFAGSIQGTTLTATNKLTTAANIECSANAGQMQLNPSRSYSSATTYGVNVLNGSTYSSTSGANIGLLVCPTYNQSSSTSANTDLLVNRTQTSVGSGAQLLVDLQVGNTSKFAVDNSGNIRTATSVSATTPGSVVKKIPIYDASGTLLGYIPIYSTIT